MLQWDPQEHVCYFLQFEAFYIPQRCLLLRHTAYEKDEALKEVHEKIIDFFLAWVWVSIADNSTCNINVPLQEDAKVEMLLAR